ncbi:hypothetical protein Hanom_Chr10g00896161 [Helianthus anomalus]
MIQIQMKGRGLTVAPLFTLPFKLMKGTVIVKIQMKGPVAVQIKRKGTRHVQIQMKGVVHVVVGASLSPISYHSLSNFSIFFSLSKLLSVSLSLSKIFRFEKGCVLMGGGGGESG